MRCAATVLQASRRRVECSLLLLPVLSKCSLPPVLTTHYSPLPVLATPTTGAEYFTYLDRRAGRLLCRLDGRGATSEHAHDLGLGMGLGLGLGVRLGLGLGSELGLGSGSGSGLGLASEHAHYLLERRVGGVAIDHLDVHGGCTVRTR